MTQSLPDTHTYVQTDIYKWCQIIVELQESDQKDTDKEGNIESWYARFLVYSQKTAINAPLELVFVNIEQFYDTMSVQSWYARFH